MSNHLHRTAKSVGRHRIVATLLGALLALGGAAAVYASTLPDFSLSAQPPSQTINSGGSANYVVSVSPSNGFSGAVTLTAGSLPKGTSASWSVGGTTSSGASVTVPSGSGTRTANLTIGGGQPNSGTYNPTVTGKSGSLTHSTALTLVVQNQNAANFSLTVNPSAQTLAQGTATSTVSITRTDWSGSVAFGAVTGLPAGASASLSPSSTTGSSGTLTVTTTSSTPAGVYTPTVPASATLSGKSSSTRYASFTLKVLPPFSISGNLASPLSLGLGNKQSLDLAITNPYGSALTVSNIQVTLSSIQQAANAHGSCGQTGPNSPNFQITQLSSSYQVTVPANATMSLSQLGTGAKPTVTWLDQPWVQNGCLGAKLNFTYTGSGTF